MELLNVTGLKKSYGGRKVVDDVSFSVNEAEIVGLLGKNGAGKTTTFRMTIGMIPSDAGRVVFEGEDVSRLPMYQRARRGMGYLAQEPSIFQRLSVEDNLLAILEMMHLSKTERKAIAAELLRDQDEFGAAADGRSRSRRSACRVLEVPLQDRVRRVVADVAAMTGVGTRPVRHDGRALAAVVIAHAVAVAQAVLGEPLLQFVLDGEIPVAIPRARGPRQGIEFQIVEQRL